MIVLGILWLICGIFAYGITYGYFQSEYPKFAKERCYADGLLALFMGCMGIIGLITSYFLSNFARRGLKWIDKKL